jgi:hypothetical protein
LNDDLRVKVLTIPYSNLDLLINRDQCSTSVYIAETLPRETSCPYLREGLKIKDFIVPLFDLDLFFRNLFKVEPEGQAHLALIRDKKTLPSFVQDQISFWEDLFYREEDRRGDKIAFRVASATVMTEVLLTDLRLQPAVLSDVMEDQGILAVSFRSISKLTCLVDLDILLENKILPAGRDVNADTYS